MPGWRRRAGLMHRRNYPPAELFHRNGISFLQPTVRLSNLETFLMSQSPPIEHFRRHQCGTYIYQSCL